MELTINELINIIETAIHRAREVDGKEALISQRQASAKYGVEFTKAVESGRIKPAQIGPGRNGKRSYRVSDILALRTADRIEARIQLSEL